MLSSPSLLAQLLNTRTQNKPPEPQLPLTTKYVMRETIVSLNQKEKKKEEEERVCKWFAQQPNACQMVKCLA